LGEVVYITIFKEQYWKSGCAHQKRGAPPRSKRKDQALVIQFLQPYLLGKIKDDQFKRSNIYGLSP
jgi:hypothetical protein